MDPRAGRAIARCAAAVLALGTVVTLAPRAVAATPVGVGFDGPVTVDTGSYAYATSIADVTGDGLVDLIVGNTGLASEASDYHLVVFAQQVDGALAPAATYATTVSPAGYSSLINDVGDLDSDGDADVAAGTVEGLDVFLQDAGVLTGPTNYPSAAGEVFDVQIADLNGDTRDDVVYTVAVTASPGDFLVVRRYQNETGTLDAVTVLATYPNADTVSIGDVTGDGQPDVVVEDGSSDGMHLLVQQDDLSFLEETDARVKEVLASVFVDVTGDGLDDLVLLRTGSPDALVVLSATAGGPLADPVGYATGTSGEHSLEAADLNGDGTSDLVVFADATTSLWLQDDVGVLHGPCSAPLLMTNPYGTKEITATGDLDGDGIVDLVGGGTQLGATLMTGFAPGETYASTLQMVASNDGVTIGDPITLSGELTPAYGCLDPGAQIEIWRSTPDTAAKKIGTALIQDTAEGYTFTFDDIPPAAGRYRYFATFAGSGVVGGSQSGKAVVDVWKRPSSVSLAISETALKLGQSTTLTARLKGPDAGTVSFFANWGAGKRLVERVKVGADGKASLKVSPTRNTRYTVEYGGNATFDGSTSSNLAVSVAAIVNGVMVKYDRKVDGTAIYECCRAGFLTWVKPKKPGQAVKVSVQYWNGSSWKVLPADKDTFRLNDDGTALIYLNIDGGAGFRFRARATWSSDSANVGGSSAWAPFKLV